MLRKSRFAAVLAVAALSGACAPVVGIHGFQAVDVQPADVVAGTDTKSTVLARLGSPSATSTFEDNIWYYISQRTERYTYNKPEVSQRSVTVITFDKTSDQVTEVASLDLDDGQQIAMNDRETPTRGRPLTALEQILGTVGRGQLPRNEENVPGQRRPD